MKTDTDRGATSGHDTIVIAGGDARSRPNERKGQCVLTGRDYPWRQLTPFGALRPLMQERVLRDHPGLHPDSTVGIDEVDRYRQLYVEEMIRGEAREMTRLEREVADSLAHHDTISENVDLHFSAERSFGEIWADRLAEYGSSWGFMGGFVVTLLAWIAVNLWMGSNQAFDPYPFILLNLVLSCIAALQAPVIMMSQRRQEAKDRMRAQSDYQVNLKAELEICHLHEKMDHMLRNQWQRLSEIQSLQVEMLQESARRR